MDNNVDTPQPPSFFLHQWAVKEKAAELPDELYVVSTDKHQRVSHVPRHVAAHMIVNGAAVEASDEQILAHKKGAKPTSSSSKQAEPAKEESAPAESTPAA